MQGDNSLFWGGGAPPPLGVSSAPPSDPARAPRSPPAQRRVQPPWEHQRTDGSGIADVIGTVVESTRPTRLVTTWAPPDDTDPEHESRVTFDIEEHDDIVRLTVTHEDLRDEDERAAAASGWAAVLSNLKSLLETGSPLPQEPWLVNR